MNKTKIFFDFKATSAARDADMISIGLVAVTEKYTEFEPLTPSSFEDALNNAKTAEDNFLKGNNKGLGIIEQLESLHRPEIKTFYAEFADFNIEKCDDWVKENVVDKLKYNGIYQIMEQDRGVVTLSNNVSYKSHTENVKSKLKEWLSQFGSVEFWCDFGVIDTPMLIDLIADWDTKEIDFSKIDKYDYEYGYQEDVKIGLPTHLPNVNYYDFYDIHTLFKVKGIDPDIDREGMAGSTIDEFILPYAGQKHNALWDAYVTWKCYEKMLT